MKRGLTDITPAWVAGYLYAMAAAPGRSPGPGRARPERHPGAVPGALEPGFLHDRGQLTADTAGGMAPPAGRDQDEDPLTFLLRTSSVRLGKWEISVPRTASRFVIAPP